MGILKILIASLQGILYGLHFLLYVNLYKIFSTRTWSQSHTWGCIHQSIKQYFSLMERLKMNST